MSFWKDLDKGELVSDDFFKSLDHDQCEAIIDALTLIIYADDEASFLEMTELEHMLHRLPWAFGSDAEVDAYTEASAERAESGDFDEIAATVAERLPSQQVRVATLEMAAELAFANWDSSEHEHDALLRLADAFEIEESRAQEIIERVAEEVTS